MEFNALYCLERLMQMPKFKISNEEGSFVFELDGLKFDASCFNVEMGLVEAYCFFKAYAINREVRQ